MKRNQILIIIALMLAIMISSALTARADAETKPAMGTHEAERTADMHRLSKGAAAILGKGWHVDTEYVKSLPGWTGRVNGAASTFSNKLFKVDGAPASFRITRTNWEEVTPNDDRNADSDIALSAVHFGYWYCNPGTFGAAHPREWEDVLKKLHNCYGLPVAHQGLVCFLETDVDVFPVGAPISIDTNFHMLPGFKSIAVEKYSNHAPFLVVTDSSGKRLPLHRLPITSSNKRTDNPGYDNMIPNLELDFNITKPGIYQIKMRYPFGKENNQIAESQEISIRVVPADFLTLQLNGLAKDDILRPEGTMPVELVFGVKGGKLKQFSEIKVSYAASKSPNQQFHYLYGSPGRRMTEDIKGSLHPDGKGSYRVKFDLAAGRWGESTSSAGPVSPITRFMKPGETWWAKMIVSGVLDGKRFRVTSNEISLRLQ
ncbi:MAG: hypothetical protein ACYC0V_04910 [Armatimonadota bacterium]